MTGRRLIQNTDEFTSQELAEFLGVCKASIHKWVLSGIIPAPASHRGKQGRTRVWTREQAETIKKRLERK